MKLSWKNDWNENPTERQTPTAIGSGTISLSTRRFAIW